MPQATASFEESKKRTREGNEEDDMTPKKKRGAVPSRFIELLRLTSRSGLVLTPLADILHEEEPYSPAIFSPLRFYRGSSPHLYSLS